jgi:pimeloyl-ACP methyl ester carboxylesterase
VLDGVVRRTIRLPESGVEIALLDWGGEGPPALLHHANGFCAALWGPVAGRLRSRFRLIAMDARGHGDSPQPNGPDPFRWDLLAADLMAVGEFLLAEIGVERFALGLGHSFGGTLTLAAASRRDLFERIVLVDPVLYPSNLKRELYPASGAEPADLANPSDPSEQSGSEDPDHGTELSRRARKRKAVWSSRSDAREFFLSKPLFAAWRPEALDLYVAEGLRERSDGQLELKCAPEVEAQVFEGARTSGLDHEVAASLLENPALLIWASRGNFPRVMYQEIVSRMRDGTIEDMAAGHLAPMEEPEKVADSVLRFCRPGGESTVEAGRSRSKPSNESNESNASNESAAPK